MDRYGVHTKTEAVDLALRHLAGQSMTRDEALAMRGAHALGDSAMHLPLERSACRLEKAGALTKRHSAG